MFWIESKNNIAYFYIMKVSFVTFIQKKKKKFALRHRVGKIPTLYVLFLFVSYTQKGRFRREDLREMQNGT